MKKHKFTVHRLMEALREGRYTSVGSYPTFFLTTDGAVLSHKAVRENIWQVARSTRDGLEDGWAIAGVDVNWENTELYCDDTNERIEAAYA